MVALAWAVMALFLLLVVAPLAGTAISSSRSYTEAMYEGLLLILGLLVVVGAGRLIVWAVGVLLRPYLLG